MEPLQKELELIVRKQTAGSKARTHQRRNCTGEYENPLLPGKAAPPPVKVYPSWL